MSTETLDQIAKATTDVQRTADVVSKAERALLRAEENHRNALATLRGAEAAHFIDERMTPEIQADLLEAMHKGYLADSTRIAQLQKEGLIVVDSFRMVFRSSSGRFLQPTPLGRAVTARLKTQDDGANP